MRQPQNLTWQSYWHYEYRTHSHSGSGCCWADNIDRLQLRLLLKFQALCLLHCIKAIFFRFRAYCWEISFSENSLCPSILIVDRSKSTCISLPIFDLQKQVAGGFFLYFPCLCSVPLSPITKSKLCLEIICFIQYLTSLNFYDPFWKRPTDSDAYSVNLLSFVKSWSVCTDTGLPELEVQFVGIGKFAGRKQDPSLNCK